MTSVRAVPMVVLFPNEQLSLSHAARPLPQFFIQNKTHRLDPGF